KSRPVPIIFITAHESPDERVNQAYTLGAVDFIIKPVVPAVLRAKVAVFVELFHSAEQVRRQAERLRQLERREFERRGREEEERFRLVAENVKDYAIFMLDTEGRVLTWNAGAERLFGYGTEEAVGSHLARLPTPEDNHADRPARELREAEATGRAGDDNWM